eukprot:353200-Chlamydomonas_euryale.AAC.12
MMQHRRRRPRSTARMLRGKKLQALRCRQWHGTVRWWAHLRGAPSLFRAYMIYPQRRPAYTRRTPACHVCPIIVGPACTRRTTACHLCPGKSR